MRKKNVQKPNELAQLASSCWDVIKNDASAATSLAKLERRGCDAGEILAWVELYAIADETAREIKQDASRLRKRLQSLRKQVERLEKDIQDATRAIAKLLPPLREPKPNLKPYKQHLVQLISVLAKPKLLGPDNALVALIQIVKAQVNRPSYGEIASLIQARMNRVRDEVAIRKAIDRIAAASPRLVRRLAADARASRKFSPTRFNS